MPGGRQMDSGSAEAALQVSVRNDVWRSLINETQHFINDDSDILLKEEVDNMKTHEV